MCGRYGCSLGAEDLSCATSYKDPKTGLFVKIPCVFTESFKPSCNIPPTMKAPIIINENKLEYSPVIVLARFGVIPPWLDFNDPSARNNKYEMHLCRFENLTNTKVHSGLYKKGWRCVIPCTAYYEWQTTKGSNKQPFCFFNKENDVESLMKTDGQFCTTSGWDGVRLLYLAGFYNIHIDSKDNNKKLYSFCIITHETEKDWTFVHHRMPAILQSEQDVRDWLDSSNIPGERALKILEQPTTNLDAHEVDKSILNNPKDNIGTECLKKYEPKKKSDFLNKWISNSTRNKKVVEEVSSSGDNDLNKKEKKTQAGSFMNQWLKTGSAKKRPSLDLEETCESKEKRPKMD